MAKQAAIIGRMKHIPTLIGVAILFAVVYHLSEATLSAAQLAVGSVVAMMVYGG